MLPLEEPIYVWENCNDSPDLVKIAFPGWGGGTKLPRINAEQNTVSRSHNVQLMYVHGRDYSSSSHYVLVLGFKLPIKQSLCKACVCVANLSDKLSLTDHSQLQEQSYNMDNTNNH